MTPDTLLSETSASGIRRLTLNDIQRRNALSTVLLTKLNEAIMAAAEDLDVRVVVIAANGPAFSAGHDLKEIRAARAEDDAGRAAFTAIINLCAQLMQAIVNCPKPVIAEVEGVATAAGCQLVASCDLAVAAEGAHFATPGVNIGLFCSTPMVAVSRNLANKHAMEMLLTGEMISAEKAYEIGLVNRVVPTEELTAKTLELAETIAAKSKKVLAIGKGAFYAQREMDLQSAYKYTGEVMVENMLNAQSEEGIGAFLDKRKPEWPDA